MMFYAISLTKRPERVRGFSRVLKGKFQLGDSRFSLQRVKYGGIWMNNVDCCCIFFIFYWTHSGLARTSCCLMDIIASSLCEFSRYV